MIDIPNKNSAYNFNLSEENMGNRVGARYLFDKINEFETQLAGR